MKLTTISVDLTGQTPAINPHLGFVFRPIIGGRSPAPTHTLDSNLDLRLSRPIDARNQIIPRPDGLVFDGFIERNAGQEFDPNGKGKPVLKKDRLPIGGRDQLEHTVLIHLKIISTTPTYVLQNRRRIVPLLFCFDQDLSEPCGREEIRIISDGACIEVETSSGITCVIRNNRGNISVYNHTGALVQWNGGVGERPLFEKDPEPNLPKMEDWKPHYSKPKKDVSPRELSKVSAVKSFFTACWNWMKRIFGF